MLLSSGMVRTLVYKTLSSLGSLEAKALDKDSKDPRQAQQGRLTDILKSNVGSAFGGAHAFSSIQSYADYKEAVPIADYESVRPYIQRLIDGHKRVLTVEEPFMLATTSGTTGLPKYIPITEGYLKEFRRASVASCYHLLKQFPEIANGVTLSVASPAEEGRTPGGIPYGAISGGLFLREPFLIRKFVSPIPYDVFLIRDYESRYYTLLRLALVLPLTCIYTLNPSTIVMLIRRLHTYGARLIKDVAEGAISAPMELPRSVHGAISEFLKPDVKRARQLSALIDNNEFYPHRIWPTLTVVCCWTKASASFYLNDFPEYFGSVPVHDITYGASEGRGTVFVGAGKQLLSVRSHFYEFIPESEIESRNPTVLMADELCVGQNYYILFTTAGGLYRYHIGDVVKVAGFYNRTPLIEFQYKGGNICSFTGEKITELHVTEAMSLTLAQTKTKVAFFTVIPEFQPNPHYKLWVEPLDRQGSPTAAKSAWAVLGHVFDRCLCAVNIEYRSKRESKRLDPIAVELISPGTYEHLRQILSDSGVADSQIKVSHLNPKRQVQDFFAKAIMSNFSLD